MSDCVFSERKGLLLDCTIGAKEIRRSEQTKVRQARLVHVCRAAEQPAVRQSRLATDHQHTHERRAAEQPESSRQG